MGRVQAREALTAEGVERGTTDEGHDPWLGSVEPGWAEEGADEDAEEDADASPPPSLTACA